MAETKSSQNLQPWIDEIPTRPSAFKALIVSVATGMLAGLGYLVWKYCPPALDAFFDRNADAAILLADNGLSVALKVYCWIWTILGAICGVCGVLSLIRIKPTYYLIRMGLMLVYPVVLGYVVVVWLAIFSLVGEGLEIDRVAQDRATAIILWWKLTWPAMAIGVYAGWLYAMLRSRSVYASFTRRSGPPMRGDETLESLRTGGRDPRARRSLILSIATHAMILIIIPYMLQMGGCVEPYRVPKGSGNPVVAMVEMKIVKPKKKKKTLTLRPNSAILFEIPDLDDTEVDRKMDQQSQNEYKVQPGAKVGKPGQGGGDKGGWPEGMDDYKIRFIRLEHSGDGWDDGMNQTGADMNFLRSFAAATGFKRIASKGESHSISLLAKYPDDGFPPFVFLTGDGNMGSVSSNDQKILRDYCLNGGLLIADAGSKSFDQTFRRFMTQVFPDKQLLDISDDEMLYQLPYGFPNGAPAFWHHGGRRALGIKHEGRWVAFYHPGDMNDAWKSPGYTDVTPEMRDAAMKLGINLVYYAFCQWNDAVTKLKK